MRLTVINWLKDASVQFVGRTIELLFRLILLILPLGIYLILIQNRQKASKVSSISVYTTPDSVWQHIFPGFILVAINPRILRDSILNTRKRIELWLDRNKYTIAVIFMTLIVFLMILNEVWGR